MSKAPDELFNLIGNTPINKLSVTINGEVHAENVEGLEKVIAAVWAWVQENYQPITRTPALRRRKTVPASRNEPARQEIKTRGPCFVSAGISARY